VLPSEKFPVAVSCSDSPTGKAEEGEFCFAGLIVMLSNAGAPTVTDALPVIP
jgi:hypothetical protein